MEKRKNVYGSILYSLSTTSQYFPQYFPVFPVMARKFTIGLLQKRQFIGSGFCLQLSRFLTGGDDNRPRPEFNGWEKLILVYILTIVFRIEMQF
ncbi:hypothetical protein DESC_730021 [Desulfosarcina cetonica]|uniref:hypothetical protein n=1 Tax=Desulfosarcina cetonica TaxID=90730 RepID=UPI0012ECD5D3|nr:hypothetical protein [Desulfosarcina cetonica]VTR69141.1 hypothetical protein DESC_730021 [Desulfosarcina cetonica]